MKTKLILLTVLAGVFHSFSFAADAKTLMTIDGKEVSSSFFEYIYNKNNSYSTAEKKTKEEYLELFKIFRLKVAEAEALKLDTAKSFKQEFEGYRNQLTGKYLTSQKVIDSLLKIEYARLQKDIDASHILIAIEGNKTPLDTLAAYEKAMSIIERAKTEDFSKLAGEFSIDPSVKQNKGHLGYISALRTVYPFENAVYNTPAGKINPKPVKTSFGYHIIKVNAIRDAEGQRLIAHIMKFTNDTTPELNDKAKKEIYELYARAKSGEDFAKLAKENSQDTYSAQNNGELPWFGRGRMVREFEDKAFSLKNKGDISTPIQTKFGWHILKLIDTKAPESFDAIKDQIEKQITNGDRAEIIANEFTQQLKKEYQYSENQNTLAKLEKLAKKLQWNDSVFYLKAMKLNKPIISFENKSINASDFVGYMKAKKLSSSWIQNSLSSFAAEELKKFENSQLEKKYPDFGNLVQEYRDGILLFNISNQAVWEKAIKDTTGLENYFAANKDKYKWESPRFLGRMISCKDEKTADIVKAIIKNNPADSINIRVAELNINDSIIVRSEQNLFAEGKNPAIDFYVFKKGEYTPNPEFPIVLTDGYLIDAPTSYTQVKGSVIQDYQNFLEKQWVSELAKKHSITVNQEAFQAIK